MRNFRSYPTLNDKLIKEIGYKPSDFKFKFTNKKQQTEDHIKISGIDDYIYLKDENNRWSYDFNDLIIDTKIRFKPKALFGEKGITPKGSILGVALTWRSKESKYRGIVNIGTFDYNDEEIDLDGRIHFREKEIRNKVEIDLIIYLKEYSKFSNEEYTQYATLPGTILGILSSKTISLVGKGSLFPIFTIADKSEPLWKLSVMNFDYEKNVEDCIMLVINESHEKYYLFENGEKFNIDFIQEVMINVVYQLLLISKQNNFIDEDYNEGTLGYLISYYKRVFDIEEKDPAELYYTLSKEIRK